MTVQELVAQLPLKVAAGQSALSTKVNGGYVSDLLSNVMGQAKAGDILVTMQGHRNIVAVAVLAGLAAVIVAGGVMPDKDTVSKADAEGITILTTELPAFEIVGRLYKLGIAGV